MTASGETDDLVVLEQTRARLEALLQPDENWRALTQSSAPGEGAASAARRARDTRLEMALADNPTYRAWRHVNEAIVALRERSADAKASEDVPAEDAPSEEIETTLGDAGPSELPQVIVDLIRAGPPGTAAHAHADAASPPAPAPEPPQPQEQEAPPSPLAEAPSARSRVVIPSVAAEPRARDKPPAAAGKPGADWEEATVTFVTREARPSLLPSAELPADLGTDRKSGLFERLRGVQDQLDGDADAFAPLAAATEEAEVNILTPEDKEEQRKAEERAGTVRRLRRALSDD